MTDPSKVLHVRNVGYEITEVTLALHEEFFLCFFLYCNVYLYCSLQF